MTRPTLISALLSAALVTACSTAPKPSDSQDERAKKVEEAAQLLTHNPGTASSPGEADQFVTDPKTGVKLVRVEKSNQYFEKDGLLYNVVISGKVGLPIIRQDEAAWYLEAPPDPRTAAAKERADEAAMPDLPPVVDVPEIEGEVVAVKKGSRSVTLDEVSDGLPTMGQWRENFALKDLNGDGRPDIVSTPPRLSSDQIQAFTFDPAARKWSSLPLTFEDPSNLGFGFGGIDVGDVDGDGILDLVYGTHSGGLTFAHGLGGLRYKLESRGLPREMAARAVELGDLDGDGNLDLMALAETPEKTGMTQEQIDALIKPLPPDSKVTYRKGFNARAYLWSGGEFHEVTKGLASACWGYSLALWLPPVGAKGESPLYIGSCRSPGVRAVAYSFDRKDKEFRGIDLSVVEGYAATMGAATGRYRGHPALFVTYLKVGPSGGVRRITGDGVSIYYEEGGVWKRKRVEKRIAEKRNDSTALAVGDLDGDGLDDIVFADEVSGRMRILFQMPDGEFQELNPAREPTFVNHPTNIRLSDLDGDGRLDVVMMYEYRTGDPTRSGGFRAFLNRP